jgi:hypothetical protein
MANTKKIVEEREFLASVDVDVDGVKYHLVLSGTNETDGRGLTNEEAAAILEKVQVTTKLNGHRGPTTEGADRRMRFGVPFLFAADGRVVDREDGLAQAYHNKVSEGDEVTGWVVSYGQGKHTEPYSRRRDAVRFMATDPAVTTPEHDEDRDPIPQLLADGIVSVSGIAEVLGVSESTARKRLAALEDAGTAFKVKVGRATSWHLTDEGAS